MQRWIVCVLLGIFCVTMVSGSKVTLVDDKRNTMGFAESPGHPLDGKQLLVRIYKNPAFDPVAYTAVSVTVENGKFQLDAADHVPGALMMIAAVDQLDEVVSKALGPVVFTLPLPEDGVFSINNLPPAAAKECIFTDGAGNLIDGLAVEIHLTRVTREPQPEILYGQLTTDELGRLDLPQFAGLFRNLRLRASHPEYGSVWIDDSGGRERIEVPIVRKGTDTRERALRGVVLDPEGKAVAGAVIALQHIRTPGEGLIQDHNGEAKVQTNEAGRFSLYWSGKNPRGDRGALVPPHSRYFVRIDAPAALQLPPYARALTNNEEVTIRLERGGRFRTVVFEDAGQPIVDPKRLRDIYVQYLGPGHETGRGEQEGNRYSLRGNNIVAGGYFLPGRYMATWHDQVREESLEFEPIDLAADSPDQLVFRLPRGIVYEGRVIHGNTGQPLKGAFVFGMNGTSGKRLVDITAKEWEVIHGLSPQPDPSDEALKPIADCYGPRLLHIMRTDAEGKFRIVGDPGEEIYGLIAVDQDYLGYMVRLVERKPDADGNMALDDIPLFPAATVVVEPRVKDTKHVSVSPKWIFNAEDLPESGRELFLNQGERFHRFEYGRWIQINQPNPVHVPAGIKLRLGLRFPYNDQWCDIDIPGEIQLAQGERRDLGAFEPVSAIQVAVEAVDEQGQSIEGIPVKYVFKKGKGYHWGVSHNTDDLGLAFIYVEPGAADFFGVLCYKDGEQLFDVKIPFQAPAKAAEEMPVYTLQLTTDQIEHLLGSAE